MPATVVTGGVSTGTIAVERIKTLRMEQIMELEPYKTTVLYLITAFGWKSVPSFRWDWQEEVRATAHCLVNGAGQVWSDTGVASQPTVNLIVDNPGSAPFLVGDMVEAHSPLDGTSGRFLARLTAIPDATHITLSAVGEWSYIGGGFTEVLAGTGIADDAELVKAGRADVEGSNAPAAQHNQTDNVYNFIQPMRHCWQVSKSLVGTDLYGIPEFQRRAARIMGIHKMAMEYLAVYGRRSVLNGATENPLRTTRGLIPSLTTNALTATSLATYTFYGGDGALAIGFDGWNSDSEILGLFGNATKLAFCGPAIMNRFSSPSFQTRADGDVGTAQDVRLERDAMSDVLKTQVRRLETANLTVKLINHKEIFRSRQSYTGTRAPARTMVVLDLAGEAGQPGMQGVYQEGLQTQIETNIQANDAHVRKDGIFTYFGFEVHNEAKHGVRFFAV